MIGSVALERKSRKVRAAISLQRCNAVLRESWSPREGPRWQVVLQSNFHCLLCCRCHAADLVSVLQRAAGWSRGWRVITAPLEGLKKCDHRLHRFLEALHHPTSDFSRSLGGRYPLLPQLSGLQPSNRKQNIDCFVKTGGQHLRFQHQLQQHLLQHNNTAFCLVGANIYIFLRRVGHGKLVVLLQCYWS